MTSTTFFNLNFMLKQSTKQCTHTLSKHFFLTASSKCQNFSSYFSLHFFKLHLTYSIKGYGEKNLKYLYEK